MLKLNPFASSQFRSRWTCLQKDSSTNNCLIFIRVVCLPTRKSDWRLAMANLFFSSTNFTAAAWKGFMNSDSAHFTFPLFDVINYVIKFHGYFLHFRRTQKSKPSQLKVQRRERQSCFCLNLFSRTNKQAINCIVEGKQEKMPFTYVAKIKLFIFTKSTLNAIAAVQNEIKTAPKKF